MVSCSSQVMQNISEKKHLLTTISELPKIKQDTVNALHALGIYRVSHLLKHLPTRYETHHGGMTIEAAELLLGDRTSSQELVTIETTVIKVIPGWRRGKKSKLEAVAEDETGRMQINWFNQPWVARSLHPDMHIRVHGSLAMSKGILQMNNPRWEEIDDEQPAIVIDGGLRPVYRANEHISSSVIAKLIADVIDDALPEIDDHLTDEMLRELEMPKLADAYAMCHKPEEESQAVGGRRRIAYDELLLLQLGVMMKRHHRRDTMRAPKLEWNEDIKHRIESRIPFTLTESQQRVIDEIANDITTSTPMNRLLQGDVGSGKTVVALHAMLMAVTSGAQGAMMAPTELLAEQHFQTISTLLSGSKVKTALLTSSLSGKDRKKLISKISEGEIDIVVGTHALLTEDVIFSNIAIAITDEQHRFGVQQRALLRNKSDDEHSIPHTLVMTATPIPRTLSLTIFGDLDVSTINGMPPGRSPITTRLVQPTQSIKVYQFMHELIKKGQQGYVVVPLVEDTDSGLKSAIAHAEYLRTGFLQGVSIGVIHGRMKSEEREQTMQHFREGTLDVLVATTVIEVGVDVSNATMIIIEHADRFGLAQLHQLRGRVGRGTLPGVCALIASPTTDDAQLRLDAIVETTDGFRIAERDLEIRGPGELFGAKQSGIAPFKAACLPRDFELLRLARRNAIKWIAQDPTLQNSPLLKSRLLHAHGEALGLGDVA
jgi:ATP-dependent DNA helicase RecG